jgi:hypothetical protein
MPWLPEFDALIMARVSRADLGGDDLTADDPIFGRAEGRAAMQTFKAASTAWLGERHARTLHVATTVGASRTVAEFDVELTVGGVRIVLPVAVVVEAQAAGGLEVRIYHSRWPLDGAHTVRAPLLSADPTLRESDVVGEYQAALAAGDAARIVATFEPDGCFREPSGPQYRRCGTAALEELFEAFFGAGGGIVLEHCSVTEDGVRTALEFNALRWGSVAMPHQAGIAVYERGATGRIGDARIYDDVAGPVE